jgi:hypothetical protein
MQINTIRFYERRGNYNAHSYESNLAGLSVRLDDDVKNNLEPNFPSSATMSIAGHPIKCSIYAFKPGAKKKFANTEGVIFTINGQTHGAIDKAFFKRQKVGMSYLADSILAIVDCSDIDGRTREDLFMNSRDRLRSGDLKKNIEKSLEGEISQHPGLRNLRESRKQQALKDKLADSKPIAEIIEKILSDHPFLAKLLGKGVRITDPFKSAANDNTAKFKSVKFPTYFTADKKFPKNQPKNCHDNFRFRVKYVTDAENQYFDRDNQPGSFTLFLDGKPASNSKVNLWNGMATVSCTLPSSAKEGDFICCKTVVTDDSQANPFEDEFWVRVIGHGVININTRRKKKKKTKNKPGNGSKGPDHLNLPPIIPVPQEDWEDHDFDQYSALSIKHAGNGDSYDFFYNADNTYLKAEQKGSPDDDAEIIETQYKSALVLIGLAILQQNKGNGSDSADDDIEESVSMFTSAISPVLLPMIRSLGAISINE